MLLTFSDCGRIARNRHEFFEDAFTALWSKHDARKEGGLERHRYTGLQKNDFVRLVSAFAISSYNTGDYDMRPAQFHRHFSNAVRLSGLTCKENDFRKDLTESTSLAVEDGPYIRFCHLSFHEYFTAVFLSETDESFVGQLIEEVSDRLDTDNVLPLLHSLNSEKIEKHWVLRKTKDIASLIEGIKRDIDKYAHLAAGDSDGQNEARLAMRKIRTLYDFTPSTAELAAAYHAAQGMRITIKQLMRKSPPHRRLFEHDMKSFQSLNARITRKYEHKSSALQDLLSRMQTSANHSS